jgi:UPF0042 nucleotide-binding protein
MTKINRPILFISGLSGAGISTALKALEDIGYEVFDNFPLGHVHGLIEENGYEDRAIAFGFDSRTRAFSPDRLIQMAKETGAQILFLNATNASLQKRFSETRRKHPLAKDRTVTDGIIYEREWLDPLRDAATRTIDTTDLSIHDLKQLIEADFAIDKKSNRLSVTIMSFGFKNGVPREIDMLYDVRFLKNPHWVADLKPLTGRDKPVQDYIESGEGFSDFYMKLSDMIGFLLPLYAAEGKSYLTIAFGCTGGKHRSVYLTEKLAEHVKDLNYTVTVKHRDLV